MSLFRKFTSLALIVLVAGCGFTPVHKKTSGSQTEKIEELYSVKIGRIGDDRSGQEVYTHLQDIFNPEGIPAQHKYRLDVSLTIEKAAQAIRKTGEITRYTIVMAAKYNLVDITSGESLLNNTSRMRGSFDAVGSDFGTYTAEEDTKSRLAREIANDIKMHIASFLQKIEKDGKEPAKKANVSPNKVKKEVLPLTNKKDAVTNPLK